MRSKAFIVEQLVIFFLAVVITFAFSYLIVAESRHGYQKEVEELSVLLAEDHRKANLLGVITALASVDEDVRKTAKGELAPDNPQTMNKLRYLFDKLELDNMIVMANDGTVNGYLVRNVDTTIVGKNFAWRPYFSGPMNRVDTSYAAFGSNSKERGFYISTPIVEDTQIQGVLVAKLGFEEVDRALKKERLPVAVLSPEGVVFASNINSWLYKVIGGEKELKDAVSNKRVNNAYKQSKPELIALTDETITYKGMALDLFKSEIGWQDPSGKWQVVGFASWRDFFGINAVLSTFVLVFLLLLLLLRLKRSKEAISKKTNQVKSLLNNSGEGFLAFDSDLIIDSEYSKACEEMLGIVPAGRDISELIGSDDAEKSFIKDALVTIFETKDLSSKRNILQLLSTEITRDERLISVDFRVIEDSKIMVVLKDITETTKIKKQLENEKKNLKMVVLAVSDPNSFFDAIDSFDRFIKTLHSRAENCEKKEELLHTLYREIHTYKGLLNQLSFLKTPDLLNEIEICLSENSVEKALDCLDIESIKSSFDDDLSVIIKSLGREFLDQGRTLLLTQDQARSLEEILSEVANGNYDNLKITKLKELLEDVSSLRKIRVADVIRSFDGVVEQIALRLDKQIAPINIVEKAEVLVDVERYRNLMQSLIHIFRNAVAHGIEKPETRWELDKEIAGNITCIIDKIGNKIAIEISDDGAGIDTEKLKAKGLELGVENIENLSHDEIVKSVFIDYMTTNQNPDDLSGRGVGLSAVASEVNKLGGSIDVSSIRGVKTSFTILLPI